MTTTLEDVTFLQGGYCLQSARLVGERSFAMRRFYAVFVYFRHPTHGPSLIDCGYGPEYLRATRHFPARLLRWTLPGTTIDMRDAEARWNDFGIDRRSIRRIFVTHFHGDHVGALRDFDDASTRFVYRRAERDHLKNLGYLSQLKTGYLDALVPPDFDERGDAIDESAFVPGEGEFGGFRTLFRVVDWWGDGSLLLVDLPGHSLGHYGVVLRTSDGPIFYVVDACWSVPALREGRKLPLPTRFAQHSYDDYSVMQVKLRELMGRSDLPVVACHCTETLRRVARRVGAPPGEEFA